jgi:hypothetical protein
LNSPHYTKYIPAKSYFNWRANNGDMDSVFYLEQFEMIKEIEGDIAAAKYLIDLYKTTNVNNYQVKGK